MKTIPFIIKSEREFLELKGDFSESVKLTFFDERPPILTGWYVFEKVDGKNIFVRKTKDSEVIYCFDCATNYLQFDRNMGILPNHLYYNYNPIGLRDKEKFEEMKKRLISLDEWR